MADKKIPQTDKRGDESTPDRRFEGAEQAAERERVREFERLRRHPPEDPEAFVTDAEMEVREADASPQDDEV